MRKVFGSLPLLALIVVACSLDEPSNSHTAAPTPDEIIKAAGGTRAQIAGGKAIHIKCLGSGSPTVILTAGAGGSTPDWSKVQPAIARMTRVCAWDRPGTGLSSPSTGVDTVADTTSYLVAALKVTRTEGPYVAVGHSLGAYESLLLKDATPHSVVGMVFVDPSIPDQINRLGRVAPASRKLNPIEQTPWLVLFAKNSRLVFNPKRNYGDMPLIVLSSTEGPKPPPGTPDAVIAEEAAASAEMHRGHRELAALSSRGVRYPVADSGHDISNDQPEAVIGAIKRVISVARKNAVT